MNAQTTNVPPVPKVRVGLLLVHGIGEQRPGDFLSQFLRGFRLLFGEDRVIEIIRHDPSDATRRIHAATIQLDDRTIFLYEVHWADLITHKLATGSFDPAQLFVVAWLPWFNRLAGLPGFDNYTKGRVVWWTCRLVPLSVLFFLGYVGLKACPHLWWALESMDAVIWRWDEAGNKRSPASAGTRSARRWLRTKPRRRKVATPLLDLRRLERRGWFDALLDRYAGDIVNVVISMARMPKLREDITMAQGALRELLKQAKAPDEVAALEKRLTAETDRRDELTRLAGRILSRFEKAAWVAVKEDQCTELQVLGHSLGTFIAYRAMNPPAAVMSERADPEIETPDSAPATLTHFHTIGSPLEKLHFFWPGLVTPHRAYPAIRAEGDSQTVVIRAGSGFRWDNFYSVSDQVSGALRRYPTWGGVTNRRIPGLGGVFTAHVSYERNPRFLHALATSLGAGHANAPETLGARMAAWFWSVPQAMMFPLFVLVVCTLGVVVLVAFGTGAAAMLVGMGKGLVFLIQFVRPDWASGWNTVTVFWWAVAFFGFLMVIGVSTFMPAWGKRVARMAVARQWRRLCRVPEGNGSGRQADASL